MAGDLVFRRLGRAIAASWAMLAVALLAAVMPACHHDSADSQVRAGIVANGSTWHAPSPGFEHPDVHVNPLCCHELLFAHNPATLRKDLAVQAPVVGASDADVVVSVAHQWDRVRPHWSANPDRSLNLILKVMRI